MVQQHDDDGGGSRSGGRKGAPAGGQRRGGSGGGRSGAARNARGGRPGPETRDADLATRLAKVLDRLPEVQAQVLRHRMGLVDGAPKSIADTARALGLSLADARDIEQRAFEHVREAVPVEHLRRFLA